MNQANPQVTNTWNIGQALANAIQSAGKVNSHTAVPAAAILWTDKESQWLAALPTLRALMPGLCTLGHYDPSTRCGPAIWLKCAIAGLIPEVQFEGVPVIYLPGVSRSDLRAIESCPRDLQPLAELQYRGGFWSQANTKDWTLGAYLASKNGGLGLSVSQDKATQEALSQVLQAGLLLNLSVKELEGRELNAEWLLGVLAPNPVRDLLAWMNDPTLTQAQWAGVFWEVFTKRCKSDFGFDPVSDGDLVAAEMLAKCKGKWAAVAELYRDSFSGFPRVYDLLAKVQPPPQDMFPDLDQLAAYPQANEQSESVLRELLLGCKAMDAMQARSSIMDAEKDHGVRRGWLWQRMGRAPLASALAHIVRVAELSTALPIGMRPDELASDYQQTGYKVDAAAIRALGAVQRKSDIDAVSAALRAVYLPWLEEFARRFQEAVMKQGGLGSLDKEQGYVADQGVCILFVDGLRYDVALLLKDYLAALGEIQISARWTSLPSVTASGKAWCSPVSSWVNGKIDDVDFQPRVAADDKPLSTHHFRKLLVEKGFQFLDQHETGDPTSHAWTETGDLDHFGHEHGIRMARDLETLLLQVVERVSELCQTGWRTVRIVTDHGWLLVPGGLAKSELPKHQAETRWGRCAVLKDSAHATPLTFGWDWCKDVQVAFAPGVSSFIAGTEYAHGGLSLQECLVPVLELQASGTTAITANATIKAVTWKGLRCMVEVDSDSSHLSVDIRTKPALAASTLVASVRPLESGKANLAVADDDHMGVAAVVVVLGSDGEVVQKQVTTVGG